MYYAVYLLGKDPHHCEGNSTAVGVNGFLDTAGTWLGVPKLNKVKGESKPKAESDQVADALETPAG